LSSKGFLWIGKRIQKRSRITKKGRTGSINGPAPAELLGEENRREKKKRKRNRFFKRQSGPMRVSWVRGGKKGKKGAGEKKRRGGEKSKKYRTLRKRHTKDQIRACYLQRIEGSKKRTSLTLTLISRKGKNPTWGKGKAFFERRYYDEGKNWISEDQQGVPAGEGRLGSGGC